MQFRGLVRQLLNRTQIRLPLALYLTLAPGDVFFQLVNLELDKTENVLFAETLMTLPL